MVVNSYSDALTGGYYKHTQGIPISRGILVRQGRSNGKLKEKLLLVASMVKAVLLTEC